MLSSKDIAVIYETLLTSPGMAEVVKINLSIPRKNILLLSKIIEYGISVKDEQKTSFFGLANKDILESLQVITDDILEKAGLKDMYDRLNYLQANSEK